MSAQTERSDIPEVLRLAREVRAGTAKHSPHRLHEAAAGDGDLYRHAMVEAGYVAQDLGPDEPFHANDPCPICGHVFGNTEWPMRKFLRGVMPSADEWAEALRAMTAARDHVKRQTDDVATRYLALRRWLRDEHPDVYAAIPEDQK